MPTALTIINRSAEIIGFKDPDESLSGNDASNFLGVLNSMIDSWSTQPNQQFVYAVTHLVQTVSGNPITIGSGATLNTIRPVYIPDGGFLRQGSIDYHFEMITREQYDAFVIKDVNGYPSYCYYEASLPTGSLYFYPAISGSLELHLPVQQRLSQFADLSTTNYTLAPGFQAALEWSLAEELAPGRRPLDPQVQRIAASKRRAIESFEPGVLVTGFERNSGNILSGWES